MAVNSNIGKVSAAIEAGRRAAAAIDYGPSQDMATQVYNLNKTMGDWQNNNDNPDLFLFGLDKWADPSRKVTK
jgi:hypothetical protein